MFMLHSFACTEKDMEYGLTSSKMTEWMQATNWNLSEANYYNPQIIVICPFFLNALKWLEPLLCQTPRSFE